MILDSTLSNIDTIGYLQYVRLAFHFGDRYVQQMTNFHSLVSYSCGIAVIDGKMMNQLYNLNRKIKFEFTLYLTDTLKIKHKLLLISY